MKQEDLALADDPEYFGIIHGDVNVSNFFWSPSAHMPCMFDWDQLQTAWFLYDLVAPMWTVVTVVKGGNPVDSTPVPPADIKTYIDTLVKGYEENGGGVVNRDLLKSMLYLRKELYRRFCTKAVAETTPDSEMGKFVRFTVSWIEKLDDSYL